MSFSTMSVTLPIGRASSSYGGPAFQTQTMTWFWSWLLLQDAKPLLLTTSGIL